MKRIALLAAILAVVSCNQKWNDLVHEEVVAEITAFEVEGQVSSQISKSSRKATVFVPEGTDMTALSVSVFTVTETAVSSPSYTAGDVIDLSEPKTLTLTTFDEYTWTLSAEVYVAPKPDDPDDPTPDEPTYKDGPQLYNMGFDLWSKEDGYDVCYGAGATADEKATWGSANKTTAMLGLPTVGPEKSFLAVEGEGKTALKLQTRSVIGKLAAGSLFNGKMDKINIWTMSAELLWGIPFTQRPKVLDGYACYQPKKIDITQSPYNDMKGKLDNGSIAVYLTDWPEPFRVSPPESLVDPENDEHIIGYGKLIFDKEMDKYEPFRLEIKYRNDRTPKYVTVVISSSALGDYFTGGEGTVFYLDEFKFLY